jgi:hypothetical protein
MDPYSFHGTLAENTAHSEEETQTAAENGEGWHS